MGILLTLLRVESHSSLTSSKLPGSNVFWRKSVVAAGDPCGISETLVSCCRQVCCLRAAHDARKLALSGYVCTVAASGDEEGARSFRLPSSV